MFSGIAASSNNLIFSGYLCFSLEPLKEKKLPNLDGFFSGIYYAITRLFLSSGV